MKICLLCLLILGLVTRIEAQEGTDLDNILSDSKVQGIVKSVKEGAEAVVRSVEEGADVSAQDVSAAVAEEFEDGEGFNRPRQALKDLSEYQDLLQAEPQTGTDKAGITPVDLSKNPFDKGSGIKGINLQDSERLPDLDVITTHGPQRPSRSMDPTTPRIPVSADLFPLVPEPRSLSQRFDSDGVGEIDIDTGRNHEMPQSVGEQLVIESANSNYDKLGQTISFWGDVVILVKGVEMSCDELRIKLGEEQEMERIMATGNKVIVTRVVTDPKGRKKVQMAKARKVVYVAATEVITLTGGPPSLQNGDQYINTTSENSRMVLNQKTGGFRVTSPGDSSGRATLITPVRGGKRVNKSLNIQNKAKWRR